MKPKEAPNIVIVNAYSARNLGDCAIVTASILLLQRLFERSNIQVMSSYAEENAPVFAQVSAESIPAVWTLSSKRSRLQKTVEGPLTYLKVMMGILPPAAKPLQSADLVVSAGGCYLFSSRRGPLGTGFIASLFHLWLSKKLGKPTCIFPNSIGPLNSGIDKRVARGILRKLDIIFSREPITTKFLKRLRLRNVAECADIAFLLTPKFISSEPLGFDISQGEPKIGLTVLDWSFFRRGTTEQDVKAYLDHIVKACQSVAEKYSKAHFYVWVQVSVPGVIGAESDLPLSEQLAALLRESVGERITLIQLEPSWGVQEIIGFYSQMDVFVASRMHSAIFALCGSVPTIALVYQPKTSGTFRLLNLQDNIYDVQQVEATTLSERMLHMLNNHEQEQAATIEVVNSARVQIEDTLTLSLKKLVG